MNYLLTLKKIMDNVEILQLETLLNARWLHWFIWLNKSKTKFTEIKEIIEILADISIDKSNEVTSTALCGLVRQTSTI